MQSELEAGTTSAAAPHRPDLRRELALVLERTLDAPAQARQAVSRWLMAHGCPARMVVNMTLVASELVTNAIVHAASAPRLVAVIGGGLLRLEVHDDAERPPVRRSAISVTGGRGLHVVEMVTEGWGWSPTKTGKYVWAEMTYDDLRRPDDVAAFAARCELRDAAVAMSQPVVPT